MCNKVRNYTKQIELSLRVDNDHAVCKNQKHVHESKTQQPFSTTFQHTGLIPRLSRYGTFYIFNFMTYQDLCAPDIFSLSFHYFYSHQEQIHFLHIWYWQKAISVTKHTHCCIGTEHYTCRLQWMTMPFSFASFFFLSFSATRSRKS